MPSGASWLLHCISLLIMDIEYVPCLFQYLIYEMPVDQSSPLFYGTDYLFLLCRSCRYEPWVLCALYFSPQPWPVLPPWSSLWWPWGWVAVRLQLLPGFSLIFGSVYGLPAFAGTNFMRGQRTCFSKFCQESITWVSATKGRKSLFY